MKRVLSISGIFLVVVSFIGIFALGMLFSPPPQYVMIAAQKIPAGTPLGMLPDTAFRQVSISTDSALLDTILTGSELREVMARGGILIKSLENGEPILWTSILVSGNPYAAGRSALAQPDPNLVLAVIPVVYTPNGLEVGDFVDLTLVVNDVRQPSGSSYAAPEYGGGYNPPAYGQTGPTATPTPTATPSPSPTPAFVVPLGKTIIFGARVTHIFYEESVQTSSDMSMTTVGFGKVTAVEITIPRTSEELIAMAISAGKLYLFATSLTAQQLDAGPSAGASVQDIIDLFYADRDRIREEGTPTPYPTFTPLPPE